MLQAVTTPTPFPQRDPTGHQVAVELVPQWEAMGGGGGGGSLAMLPAWGYVEWEVLEQGW